MPDHLTLDEAAMALRTPADEVLAMVRRGDLYGIRTADGQWLVTAANVEAYRSGRPQSAAP